MDLKEGTRIDRYTLLAPLGEGNQGAVWKVLDPLDGGVERALKLVPTDGLPPEAFERARREAKALTGAPHPNLVACHGFFEDIPSGFVGLVLELVEGRSLHEVCDDPRMDADHQGALLVQLAEALAHIHSVEIVHRDLKPENVLVTEAFWALPRSVGAIKIVDFGIAIQHGNPRPLTQLGQVVGTLPYLAPEAVLPHIAPDAAAGYARDVFAYGVIAYELFTRRHPTGVAWTGTPADFVGAYAKAASGTLSWPPGGLPPRWQEPVSRCLALAASDRPASGIDLLEMLFDQASEALEKKSDPRPLAETRPDDDPEPAPVKPPPTLTDRPSQRPTHAAPPPPERPPEETPERPREEPKGGSRAWIALALVLALGGAGFMVVNRRVAPPPAKPAPAPDPTLSATTTRHAAAAPSVCPVLCCGGYACAARPANVRGCPPEGGHCRACPSGRSCVPGACESMIPEDGAWRLRVAGVTANGKDISPRPEVCLRRSGAGEGAWVCTPPGSADPRATRLRVTTADLTSSGIDLEVRRAGGTASGAGVHHPAIGVAALCKGLNFRFTAEGAGYAVTIFLDDEEDPASP